MSSVWGSLSLVSQRNLGENKAKEGTPGILYLLSIEEGTEAYFCLMGQCKGMCHKVIMSGTESV